MSKKKKIVILTFSLAVLALLGLLIYFLFIKEDKKVIETDALKFKEEYEKYNGKINEKNNSKYMDVEIDEKNPIKYSNYEEIFDILDNGTGVIYFGFPECPWCRNFIPVLLDAAKEVGIERIFYLNNSSDRDTKELKDGKIVTTKEATNNYNKLVEKLGDKLGSYNGLNDPSIKRLYFPTTVFVSNGEILDIHVATLESQTNPSKALTKQQYNELKNILIDNITEVISCSDAC